MKKRFDLTSDYSISRILKGHWQLASDHLVRGHVDRSEAIRDMHAFADAGITTFDVADIYTGAEELIGAFLKEKPSNPVQIHTKYVPDMDALSGTTFDQTNSIITRSLKRLGLEALDLVQFHWWDYSVPRYVEVGCHLQKLKELGKIKNIGVTNFDSQHLKQLIDAGINVVSAQIQYSFLDQRPENSFVPFCAERNIYLLCYGALAGGFISERWLNQPAPDKSQFENRSLAKYSVIIDEIGGWDNFQDLLKRVAETAKGYELSVAEMAAGYILGKAQVAGTIIGSHNSNHLARISRLLETELSPETLFLLEAARASKRSVPGDIYGLERNDERHKNIMKFNLNTKGP